MTFLVQAGVALAIALLEWAVRRHELIESGRQREIRAALEHARRAYDWKEANPLPRDPDLRDRLKVKDDGRQVPFGAATPLPRPVSFVRRETVGTVEPREPEIPTPAPLPETSESNLGRDQGEQDAREGS